MGGGDFVPRLFMTPFQKLKDQLRQALAAASPERPFDVIRVSIDIAGMDLLTWLASQALYPRFFWRDEKDEHIFAAVGSTLALTTKDRTDGDGSWAVLREVLDISPASRFIGGMGFHSRICSREWNAYGGWTFTLPAFEMEQLSPGKCRLTAQVFLAGGQNDQVSGLLQVLEEMTYKETLSSAGFCLGREESMPFEDWQKSVKGTIERIRIGEMTKAVLARRSRLKMASSVDPAGLLRALLPSQGVGFMFQPAFSSAFLGVSPELLYRRNKNKLETVALAGTRPRSSDPLEDKDLGDELLRSAKEFNEHRIVVEGLGMSVRSLCSSFKIGSRQLMTLAHQMHLMTPVKGTLRPGIDDQQILEALYPTAAVCGAPREVVMSYLAAEEPFDRGWYSGAVGWLSRDDTVMVTAIRSCLVDRSDIYVYAGAGVGPGSTPHEEWNEINIKMKNITDAVHAC